MAQPEQSFRIGAVSASVFLNTSKGDDGSERSFRSVSLQRRYRSGENWKSSTTFTLGDLPNAITALEMAKEYVAAREASSATQPAYEQTEQGEPAI